MMGSPALFQCVYGRVMDCSRVQRESVWIWGASRGDAPLQLKCTHIYTAIQGWWLVFIHCGITMHFYHLRNHMPIPASHIFKLDKVFISYSHGENCYQNSPHITNLQYIGLSCSILAIDVYIWVQEDFWINNAFLIWQCDRSFRCHGFLIIFLNMQYISQLYLEY